MEKKVYPKPVTRAIEIDSCQQILTASVKGNADMRWSKSGFENSEEDR